MTDQHGNTPFGLTSPVPPGKGDAVTPAPARAEDAARWAAEQRELTRLGLHDLRSRFEQQPDLRPITVGAGQQEDVTIAGFPEDAFQGIGIVNNTTHTLRVTFGTSSAAGAPLLVPPKTLLVWPVQYQNVTINADTSKPAEQVLVLRLRYPPAQPALELLPTEGPRETWSEEENATAATVKLKVPGKAGKRIVVTSVIAQFSALGAVGAEKVLQGSIKRGGTTVFRFNLTQQKTAAEGATGTFTSGPINVTLEPGEELVIEVTGAEANANVLVDASGYYQ